MKKISLVIPCLNEEETIPLLYKELNHIMRRIKKYDFEIFFIDDGSIDKTLELLRKISKKDKRVRYISFSRNFGKEAAIYAGLKECRGDFTAIMDADLQDPPEKLIEMISILEKEEVDCVALYNSSYKKYGLIRCILTKLWYKIANKLSNTKQMTGARDFRLMKKEMVDAILSLTEYNRFTKGLFSYVGFHTKWISYDTPNRVKGKSKYSMKSLIKYGLNGIVSSSEAPLTLSVYIGMIFCLISFLAIIFIIIKTLIWGDPTTGWPSLACIIIFVSGVQLFFLGIIGTYISKIYLEVKERPLYIIKERSKKGRK